MRKSVAFIMLLLKTVLWSYLSPLWFIPLWET